MNTEPVYPIGRSFEPPAQITPSVREQWLQDLADAPANLRAAAAGLSTDQVDTPYREGGWTLRQIVHHLTENDMVSYARFKFALTEDRPQIKAMAEDLWANLPDRQVPIESSLTLFELIHERWVTLLKGLKEEDFSRVYVHPVSGEMRLELAMGLFAWHDKHHTAQISSFRRKMGW